MPGNKDHSRTRAASPYHWWLASFLLVAIGATVGAYLLARSFALLGSAPRMLDLCLLLFSTSCDSALADNRYWILGVPMAGWALVYFTVLAGLLCLARFLKGAFTAEALLAGWLVTLAGVAAGLVPALAALLGRGSLCPLCLVVLAINLMLLFTVHKASARSVGEQFQLLGIALDWLLRSRAESSLLRWKLLGFASVALAGLVTYQWIYVQSALRRQYEAASPSPAQIIAAYRAAPRLAVPVDEGDPHLGALDAPVQLVVFASFQCPACRSFAPTLSRMRETFGDRLLVAFKHYPLSAGCNPRLTVDQQPGACDVAWAAEAAHRQGRFWQFHDAIFGAPNGADEAVITGMARELELDLDRFATDRRSESAIDRVAENIELGNRLQIPGTPAVFLDGRLVRPAGETTLEILIREELEVAGRESIHADHADSRPQEAGSENPAVAGAVARAGTP